MSSFSYANLANAAFIEQLYASYLQNPESVDLSWRRFFDGMQFIAGQSLTPKAQLESADLRLYFLIEAYRRFGHQLAHFNPLHETIKTECEEVKLDRFGIKE